MGAVLDAAGQLAAPAGKALAKDARKHPSSYASWGAVCLIAGMICATTFLLVKDARDGHAMTLEEYTQANRARDEALRKDNAERDERLALVRQEFREMTSKLTGALEGVGTLKAAQESLARDVRESEARLRVEIQGTNSRVDRVLERLVERPPK